MRPEFIPVCRLQYILPYAGLTCWRKANSGVFGEITKDSKGRAQVAIAEVERAEGRCFSDEALLHALATPSRNPYVPRSPYNPSRVIPYNKETFTKDEVEAIVANAVRDRDFDVFFKQRRKTPKWMRR